MAGKSKEMELAIKIAGKVESSFTNALGAASKGIQGVAKGMTAATTAAVAAVGAIGVAAVNVGREFESAMSQVQATMLIDTGTEEGAAAMATLEQAARDCGASTAFSATEAAEALNYLALAGYNADEAATALPTVLRLAGAGAMDLAAASDMVTDSMSALGIEATEDNLNSFADQLAQTASKANTSVAQLGEAILTVGGTAKGLKGGTTELNTALGILADNGLKGAEGGTHLRNIILSLQSPTDDAANALKGLGVDVYDAEGNMRGLNEVFGDLNTSMDGMSNAQKDNLLSTLFNKTDLTAANAMLSNCTDRFDELSATVENSAGACQDMYEIQLDNLNGDIDILKSGLSDLGISIYKDLNGPLREMTQLGTSMVGELSEAYKEGGMAGMVGAVGDCLAQVVDVIAEYAPQVVSMGISLLENFIGGITENSGELADAAAEVLSVFIDGLFSLVPQVLLAGIEIITQFAQSITTQLPQLISNGTQAIQNFVSGIIQRLPMVIQTALTLVQTLVSSLGANAPMLISSAIQLITSLLTGILQMLPSLVQMGMQLLISLTQGIVANLPLILQSAVQLVMNFVSGIAQMLPTIIQSGIQLIITLIQSIIANLGNITQAAVQIIITLATGLISAIPQLVSAIPQLIEAIVETILNTNWLDVGIQIIKGLIDGILSTGKSLWSAIKSLITGGDVEMPDVSSQGVAVTERYAAGIEANAGTVSAAASTLSNSAFTGMDYTGATAAGAEASSAFTMGLSDSMGAYTFDTSSMGLDTMALNTTLTTAGTTGGQAFTNGLSSSVAKYTVDTAGIVVDATGLNSNLTTAGTTGAAAIGTGIQSNAETVTAAATAMGTDINTALSGAWDSAQTTTNSAMNAMTEKVKTAAQTAANAVKAAFESLSITIPKPKVPVINTAYRTESYGNGGSVSLPQFNVSWNAAGGIFTEPTILGSSGGGYQGVGEAGAEAILPLDTLWTQMRTILTDILQRSSGGGVIDALIEKLQGIGGGGTGGGGPELAGAGGPNFIYSPTYNLYGSAGKDEVAEADKLSQAEFNKLMKQWQKDNDRKKF